MTEIKLEFQYLRLVQSRYLKYHCSEIALTLGRKAIIDHAPSSMNVTAHLFHSNILILSLFLELILAFLMFYLGANLDGIRSNNS